MTTVLTNPSSPLPVPSSPTSSTPTPTLPTAPLSIPAPTPTSSSFNSTTSSRIPFVTPPPVKTKFELSESSSSEEGGEEEEEEEMSSNSKSDADEEEEETEETETEEDEEERRRDGRRVRESDGVGVTVVTVGSLGSEEEESEMMMVEDIEVEKKMKSRGGKERSGTITNGFPVGLGNLIVNTVTTTTPTMPAGKVKKVVTLGGEESLVGSDTVTEIERDNSKSEHEEEEPHVPLKRVGSQLMLKDSDVTWLYGPLHTAHDPAPLIKPASPSLDPRATGTRSLPATRYHTPTPGAQAPKKPILKYRSLSDIFASEPIVMRSPSSLNGDTLKDEPGYFGLIEEEREGEEGDEGDEEMKRNESFDGIGNKKRSFASLKGSREKLSEMRGRGGESASSSRDDVRSINQYAATTTGSSYSGSTTRLTEGFMSPAPSSRFGSVNDLYRSYSDEGRHRSHRKHISFNARVDQCIAVNEEELENQVLSESRRDIGDYLFKRDNRRRHSNSSFSGSSKAGAGFGGIFSDASSKITAEPQTIVRLEPTMLKSSEVLPAPSPMVIYTQSSDDHLSDLSGYSGGSGGGQLKRKSSTSSNLSGSVTTAKPFFSGSSSGGNGGRRLPPTFDAESLGLLDVASSSDGSGRGREKSRSSLSSWDESPSSDGEKVAGKDYFFSSSDRDKPDIGVGDEYAIGSTRSRAPPRSILKNKRMSPDVTEEAVASAEPSSTSSSSLSSPSNSHQVVPGNYSPRVADIGLRSVGVGGSRGRGTEEERGRSALRGNSSSSSIERLGRSTSATGSGSYSPPVGSYIGNSAGVGRSGRGRRYEDGGERGVGVGFEVGSADSNASNGSSSERERLPRHHRRSSGDRNFRRGSVSSSRENNNFEGVIPEAEEEGEAHSSPTGAEMTSASSSTLKTEDRPKVEGKPLPNEGAPKSNIPEKRHKKRDITPASASVSGSSSTSSDKRPTSPRRNSPSNLLPSSPTVSSPDKVNVNVESFISSSRAAISHLPPTKRGPSNFPRRSSASAVDEHPNVSGPEIVGSPAKNSLLAVKGQRRTTQSHDRSRSQPSPGGEDWVNGGYSQPFLYGSYEDDDGSVMGRVTELAGTARDFFGALWNVGTNAVWKGKEGNSNSSSQTPPPPPKT